MWTKIKGIISSIAGIIIVLATLAVITIIGIMVMFVGYFFMWGLLGLCIMIGIAFLIYCIITED